MEQVIIIIFTILWTVAIIGIGAWLYNVLSSYGLCLEVEKTWKLLFFGVLGMIIIAILGTILNFFLPLNSYVTGVILAIGIGMTLWYKKDIYSGYTWWHGGLLIMVGMYSTALIFMKVGNYDTGLYHLPMLNWLTSFKLPVGIANLHSRFGFNSVWFVDAAIIRPITNSSQYNFFIINAIINFLYGTFLFFTGYKLATRERVKMSDIFAISTFLPWVIVLIPIYSSFSPDIPIILLTFFVVYLCIKYFEAKKISFLYFGFILAVFMITVKLSTIAFSSLLGAYIMYVVIKKYRYVGWYKNKKFIITSIVIIIMLTAFFARGIVSSGYVLYPAVFPHLNLEWGVSVDRANGDAKWAKCWPKRYKGVHCFDTLENYNWVGHWLEKYTTKEDILIKSFISSLGLMCFVFIIKRRKHIKILTSIGALVGLSCIFWFIMAPALRFGYGVLWAFAGIIFSWSVYNLVDKINSKLIWRILLLVCLGVLIIQIIEVTGKFRMKKRMPVVKYTQKISNDGDKLYIPAKGDQCWNGPLLCAPGINKNLKIFYNKNNKPCKFIIEK